MTINERLTATFIKYKGQFVDQVFDDSVFLSMFGGRDVAPKIRRARNVKKGQDTLKMEGGGAKFQMELMSKKNATFSHHSGHDTFDVSPQEVLEGIEYDWRSANSSINLAQDELDFNDAPYRILNLLEAHKDNAAETMSEEMNNAIAGIRTATKQPIGMMDYVKDDPTTNPTFSGNLGGIDSSTNSFWRNQQIDHAAATFGTDQTGTGMTNLRNLLHDCSFGTKKPHVIVGGQVAFEAVHNAMVNQERYTNVAVDALVNAGFTAMSSMGIPLVMAKEIATLRTANSLSGDALYALNLDYLKLYGFKKRWFEPTKMKQAVNQENNVMTLITRYQLACNGRRYQGVLHNVT